MGWVEEIKTFAWRLVGYLKGRRRLDLSSIISYFNVGYGIYWPPILRSCLDRGHVYLFSVHEARQPVGFIVFFFLSLLLLLPTQPLPSTWSRKILRQEGSWGC